MRTLMIALLCMASIASIAQSSPLGKYAKEWNDKKYAVCNTAAAATYMNREEQEVIYVLNLVRMNPSLFAKTVVRRGNELSEFVDTTDKQYFKTLIAQLERMQPLPLLQPDEQCTRSARCHATTSGKTGYVGHDRQTAACKKLQHFRGECCHYGSDGALETVLLLLIDQGVPSLGHRNICLGDYTQCGVAIAAHKKYGQCAVLDFWNQ